MIGKVHDGTQINSVIMDQTANNPTPGSERKPDAETVIPVIEEQLHADKKVVETGRVKVSKTVTQREESVTLPLDQEEVKVERVVRNEIVKGEIPQIRHEGDTTIIPVLREEVVVKKRLMLVEELHITKKRSRVQHTENIILRKEEATIEKHEPGGQVE